MWPKLLMQLFELMPHLTRLVPMADKFIASRAATDASFRAIAENMRGDIGQIGKGHEVLFRKLQEQETRVADLQEEMQRTRSAVEQAGRRIVEQEEKLASAALWIKLGFGLNVVLVVLVIILLMRR